MRRREPARVLGPYKEDALWRIIEIDARGRRKSYTAASRQAATRLMARIRANLGARTVQATIELWETARLRSGDAQPTTIAAQSSYVRAFLGPLSTLRIGDVTERKALALYERATKEPTQKTGQPLRPATHRFYLYLVQSLWAWAYKQGYVQHNPWAEIEPVGRISSGKPQLRPAEARRFAQRAEQEATAGSGVALAALCCLSLGLRASEALGITARDLDAEAGEVYINGTKTAASKRRLKMPPALAALLVRAAAIRQPTERLCLASRQALHSAVIGLCARAGVPRVCVHALRGTHASLAVAGGAAVEAVARVLGHTSTKMTLGHYVTEETATAARVAAVAASLSLPHHSDSISDPNSPTGGPTGNSLPLLSAPRRDIDPPSEVSHSSPTGLAHLATMASASAPRAPDSSRHSPVCCCLLCEQHGTGEQAMRQARGNYARFLALVASSEPRTDAVVSSTGRSVSLGRLSASQARPRRKQEA